MTDYCKWAMPGTATYEISKAKEELKQNPQSVKELKMKEDFAKQAMWVYYEGDL